MVYDVEDEESAEEPRASQSSQDSIYTPSQTEQTYDIIDLHYKKLLSFGSVGSKANRFLILFEEASER